MDARIEAESREAGLMFSPSPLRFGPSARRAASGARRVVWCVGAHRDDSDVNRRALVEQVTAWGLRAETCAAGVDALRMLREAHTAGTAFDQVIADDQMPGLDGAGLAAAV